ncbi:MAG: hypothetical protein R3C40_03325 [Parvularculaceae bacterium]
MAAKNVPHDIKAFIDDGAVFTNQNRHGSLRRRRKHRSRLHEVDLAEFTVNAAGEDRHARTHGVGAAPKCAKDCPVNASAVRNAAGFCLRQLKLALAFCEALSPRPLYWSWQDGTTPRLQNTGFLFIACANGRPHALQTSYSPGCRPCPMETRPSNTYITLAIP